LELGLEELLEVGLVHIGIEAPAQGMLMFEEGLDFFCTHKNGIVFHLTC
jgi:hypothetical protein